MTVAKRTRAKTTSTATPTMVLPFLCMTMMITMLTRIDASIGPTISSLPVAAHWGRQQRQQQRLSQLSTTPFSVLEEVPTTTGVMINLRGGDSAASASPLSDTTTSSLPTDSPSTPSTPSLSRGGSVKRATMNSQMEGDDEKDEQEITPVATTTLPAHNITTTTIYNNDDAQEEEDDDDDIQPLEKKKKHFWSRRKKSHKLIAKKLKNRNHTNLRRKIMHTSFGFFFAALHHLIPKSKFVPGMTILTSATLLMELLRYRKHFGWMNDILHFVLGSSLRKHEMDGKFTGSFYYFLGVTITAALYTKSSATLGILQLAIADPAASYFGKLTRHVYWSRIENGLGGFGRNKGLLGFLGGAIACVPNNYRILSLAVSAQDIPRSTILAVSFAIGLAGAFADLAVPTPTITMPRTIWGLRGIPPFHIDDNFVVPIVSGYACQKILGSMMMVGSGEELKLARWIWMK